VQELEVVQLAWALELGGHGQHLREGDVLRHLGKTHDQG
jgi:hypothetical protein